MRKRKLKNLEILVYLYEKAKKENLEIEKDFLKFLNINRNEDIFIIDSEREKEIDMWYEKYKTMYCK